MKKINKITSSKTFYIVVSFLVSILLWMYVVNYENKEADVTISGIKVNYTGESDILEDRALLVTDKNEHTVELTIRGRRSVVASLKKEDIIINADLTGIRSTGPYNVTYTVEFASKIDSSGLLILEKKPEIITVNIDKLTTKTNIEVRADFEGSVEEGYMMEPIELDPDTISISGPEEEISKVAYALVLINRENLTKTVSGNVSYKLMDSEDKEVNSDKITASPDIIEYKIPVVKTKDVVLSVDLIPGGGAKKEDVTVEISPQVITLSGDAATLNTVNQLNLGTIDLDSFITSTEQTFMIPLPNEVNNLSGETEATVTVSIKNENLVTKAIIATNIELINVAEGYHAIPITQYMEVTIRGPKQIVELVEANNISIVADLKDLGSSVGRYSVKPKISINGYSEAGVINTGYAIVVELREGSPEDTE
jgi:YbbR domain-containing protein